MTLYVDRSFLTFPELVRRWGGDSNLLRHALVNRKLVPTVFLDADPGCGDGEASRPEGLFYLHEPKQSAVLDCAYQVASAEAKLTGGAPRWDLPEVIPLDAVLMVGVLDLEQVERYESANPRKVSLGQVRLDLRTLERASLLKMVIGMAVAGFGYNPSDRRSAVIPEIGESIRRCGMNLDDDTVRKWLYEGAESQLPLDWQQHYRGV